MTAINMAACGTLAWVNVRLNRQKKVELAKLVAERGWTEEDVVKEREKAAFLDLTDRENVFFAYTR